MITEKRLERYYLIHSSTHEFVHMNPSRALVAVYNYAEIQNGTDFKGDSPGQRYCIWLMTIK